MNANEIAIAVNEWAADTVTKDNINDMVFAFVHQSEAWSAFSAMVVKFSKIDRIAKESDR